MWPLQRGTAKIKSIQTGNSRTGGTDFRHNTSGGFVIAGTCEAWFLQSEKKESA
jgi:hypothetical protein